MGVTMGYIFCICFLLIYYGLFCGAMISGGVIKDLKKLNTEMTPKYKIAVIVVISSGFLLTVYWPHQDRFVYFWDNSGYWLMSINRMNTVFRESIVTILKSLWHSINTQDYNSFAPTVVALPMKILGYTFPRYVAINHLMFLLPALIIQALTAIKLFKDRNCNSGKVFSLALILSTVFSANYYSMYRGYIDIAILVPIAVLIYLLVDYDFQNVMFAKNIFIGLMFVVLWITRRFAVYFIIGYIFALLVKMAFQLVNSQKKIKLLKRAVIDFLIMGGVSLGIFLIFFRAFLKKVLLTNYREMYSAYNYPFDIKIRFLVETFGYFSLILIAFVGILCFCFKRNRQNWFCLMSMMAVTVFAFWQTQTMGQHHCLMLNVPLFTIFIMMGTFYNLEICKHIITKGLVNVGLGLCTLLIFSNFYLTYIPHSSSKYTKGFFSEKYIPWQRDDLEVLEQITEYLNTITEGTDDRIYVLASGSILNSDILRRMYMPYIDDAVPSMYNTHDVDLRSGFPTNFLNAQYIVTTDPVQLHLSSGQEVVKYLAVEIQDSNSYIGCHFREITSFQLDKGINAKVYKKNSDWTELDLEKMREYYNNLYPGHEDIFGGQIY